VRLIENVGIEHIRCQNSFQIISVQCRMLRRCLTNFNSMIEILISSCKCLFEVLIAKAGVIMCEVNVCR
jgi:hypothetical protein